MLWNLNPDLEEEEDGVYVSSLANCW
jgi:hypothetical protein